MPVETTPLSDLRSAFLHVEGSGDVCHTPDGAKLLTAGADARVCVSNARTLAVEQRFESFAAPVHALTVLAAPGATTVTPEMLFAAGDGGSCALYSLATGELDRVVTRLPGPVLDIAYLAKDGSLVVVGDDTEARIVSGASSSAAAASTTAAAAVRTLRGAHSAAIRGVAADPRGAFIATAGCDGSLCVWRIAEAQQRAVTVPRFFPSSDPETDQMRCRMQWDRAGAMLALPGRRHVVLVPRAALESREEGAGEALARALETLPTSAAKVGVQLLLDPEAHHNALVSLVAWSPSGEHLASASPSDHSVAVWHVQRRAVVARVQLDEPAEACALSWSPDGRALVILDHLGTVHRWASPVAGANARGSNTTAALDDQEVDAPPPPKRQRTTDEMRRGEDATSHPKKRRSAADYADEEAEDDEPMGDSEEDHEDDHASEDEEGGDEGNDEDDVDDDMCDDDIDPKLYPGERELRRRSGIRSRSSSSSSSSAAAGAATAATAAGAASNAGANSSASGASKSTHRRREEDHDSDYDYDDGFTVPDARAAKKAKQEAAVRAALAAATKAAAVAALPRAQLAFQNGAVPRRAAAANGGASERFVAWNLVGAVVARAAANGKGRVFEAKFLDVERHRGWRENDTYGLEYAALGDDGVLFASRGDGVHIPESDAGAGTAGQPAGTGAAGSAANGDLVREHEHGREDDAQSGELDEADGDDNGDEMEEETVIEAFDDLDKAEGRGRRSTLKRRSAGAVAALEAPCTLFFRPHASWGMGSGSWCQTLPAGEAALCLAAGAGWSAAATSRQWVRLFGPSGVQRGLFSLPGAVVTMAGRGSRLAVVYHAGAGARSCQRLAALMYDVDEGAVLWSGAEVPLSRDATLRWMELAAFTGVASDDWDEVQHARSGPAGALETRGAEGRLRLVTLDSAGVLRVALLPHASSSRSSLSLSLSSSSPPPSTFTWVPVLDTHSVVAPNESVWPLGLADGGRRLMCVTVRRRVAGGSDDGAYPTAALAAAHELPPMRELRVTLPLLGATSGSVDACGSGADTESHLRSRLMLREFEAGGAATNQAILRAQLELDKTVLAQIMTACAKDRPLVAFDLLKHLVLEKSWHGAIKLANHHRLAVLAERMSAALEARWSGAAESAPAFAPAAAPAPAARAAPVNSAAALPAPSKSVSDSPRISPIASARSNAVFNAAAATLKSASRSPSPSPKAVPNAFFSPGSQPPRTAALAAPQLGTSDGDEPSEAPAPKRASPPAAALASSGGKSSAASSAVSSSTSSGKAPAPSSADGSSSGSVSASIAASLNPFARSAGGAAKKRSGGLFD